MKFDVDNKMYDLKNLQLFYFLLEGLTYTEIANKYYSRNKNRVIYEIRKLLKKLNLQNRRQLVFYAVKNNLV